MRITITLGTKIDDAAQQAVDLAKAKNEPVAFDFNGYPIVALPCDNPETVAEYYRRLCQEHSFRR